MQNIMTVSLLILLLSGCGAEIAYKRGANAQDLQKGKAACQAADNEQALNQCLADNGWAVHKLDGSTFSDDELFATVTDTKDNRMTGVKAEKTNNTVKTTSSLEAETTMESDHDAEIEVKDKPKVEKVVEKTAVVKSNENADVKSKSKPKPSIFDTYVIKSWWKMGGNLSLLEQNMTECSDQLGEAHRPNKKTFTFTRGFAICMRQKGWRGLIEK